MCVNILNLQRYVRQSLADPECGGKTKQGVIQKLRNAKLLNIKIL